MIDINPIISVIILNANGLNIPIKMQILGRTDFFNVYF